MSAAWVFSVSFWIWFFLTAVFAHAARPRFVSSVTVGLVAKSLLVAFEGHKWRVADEPEIPISGVPPADARKLEQTLVERATALGMSPAAWVRPAAPVVRDGDEDRIRAMTRSCTQPTGFLFSDACQAFNDLDRTEIDHKAASLRRIFDTAVANQGVERIELERRRLALLLQANAEFELAGDFSKSSPKAREMVVTLVAAGLTAETLLETACSRDIFARVLAGADDEMTPA